MIIIPGKIPIRIHPYFWMIIFLISWLSTEMFSLTFLWAFVIFGSVLIHEYGHALTALFFGQKAQIDLVATGGLTQRSGPPLKLGQEFIVVLNGPLAGFLLYYLATVLNQKLILSSIVSYGLHITARINLVWTIFNLIPIQPMDGGRLFSIIMEYLFGHRGVKIALFLSMVLAAVLAALSFYFNFLFAGAILLMFMFEGYRNWQNSLKVADYDHQSDLQLLFQEATNDLNAGRFEDAFQKFNQVKESTGSGMLHLSATQSMASLLADQKKYHEAIELLLPLEKKLTPDAMMLLHYLFYKTDDFKKAIEIGKKAYQLNPNYHTALINAFCHARLGEVKPAIGWLQCSVREGLPNLNDVIALKDFDPIREDPQFKKATIQQ